MNILSIKDELQSLLASGTGVPGFRKKVLVDVDKLNSLGENLNNAFPTSLNEAQEILKQKQSIVNQAYLEAQRIKAAAEEQAEEIKSATQQQATELKIDAEKNATELKTKAEHEYLARISESEIVKSSEVKSKEIHDDAVIKSQAILRDAQKKANELINNAEVTSKHHRDGADQYAREVLFNLEERMAEQLGQVRRGIDAIRSEDEVQVKNAIKNETSSTEPPIEKLKQLPLLHHKIEPVDQPISA